MYQNITVKTYFWPAHERRMKRLQVVGSLALRWELMLAMKCTHESNG